MKSSFWKTDSFLRTGLSHAARSEPCQDYVLLDGTRGAALCDGVSRCVESEKASRAAAEATIACFRELVGDTGLVKALISPKESDLTCRDVAREVITAVQSKVSEYPGADTTLTFVYRLNERYAVIGYIGDSAVIVVSDGKATVYTQSRDYGESVTESVAHRRAGELLDVRVIDMAADGVKAFILTSDGLEEKLYLKGAGTRAFKKCEDCVNSVFDPDGHAKIERYIDEVTADGVKDDDISLAIMARDKVSLPDDPKWLCTCGHRNGLMSTYCENCDADYYTVYSRADLRGFPSVWDYFSYLNAHPEEELKVIGLKSLPQTPRTDDRSGSDTHEPERDDDFERDDDREDSSAREDGGRSGGRRQGGGAPQHVKTDKPSSGPGKRFAIVSTVVCLILCGALIAGFFRILSVTKEVEELQGEIDRLRAALAAQAETSVPAAVSETVGAEATPGEADASQADLTEAVVSVATPEEPTPGGEAEASVKYLAKQAVNLYSMDANGHIRAGVIGRLDANTEVLLLEETTRINVKWFRVSGSRDGAEQTASLTGWAPASFFTEAAADSDDGDAGEGYSDGEYESQQVWDQGI